MCELSQKKIPSSPAMAGMADQVGPKQMKDGFMVLVALEVCILTI